MDRSPRPAHTLQVHAARQFRVTNGANFGDPVAIAEDMALDDVYALSPVAALHSLTVEISAAPPFRISPTSEVGQPGAEVHLDACLTFMSGDGETTEALVLVETDAGGHAAAVYLMPLAALRPKDGYVLVGIDPEAALARFAEAACVSFTRGTLITMATGEQRPVEALSVGDRVLTRDDGPQPIRWIGHRTTRAVGAFAPIVIGRGTLNNTNDLVVSPDHRLFIYQRADRLGAGRSELLVRARHLVNGTTIYPRAGGHVDYFHMLFDHHQIIYAEGIAAESLLVDGRTRAALPDELGSHLQSLLPDHTASSHDVFEASRSLLARPDIADLLRRASLG